MNKITKAVIACGGWSTRFLPTVKTYAKQLVPILDKPQIHYVVEELIGAGITDIAIVQRQGEETLQKHFTPDQELNEYLEKTGKTESLAGLNNILSKVKFTFLPQTPNFPYGNGTPILVAKDFIGQDSFFYLWGDDMTIEDKPGNFLLHMVDVWQQTQAKAVISTFQVPWEEVDRYGTMRYKKDSTVPYQIEDIPEKLPRDQAPSNFINAARFIVPASIIPILENLEIDRGELWFVNAVSVLAKSNIVVTANYADANAQWSTTGDPQNWLKTNLKLAKNNPKFASILDSIK